MQFIRTYVNIAKSDLRHETNLT